jgi:anaerobic dimethyl sulfoxide reductase subunit A
LQSYFPGLAVTYTAAHYRPKILDPPGECKPNEWITTQLAKRLGILEKYNKYYTTDDKWDEMWSERVKDAFDRTVAEMKTRGAPAPTWEEFKAGKYLKIEDMYTEPWYAFKDQIEKGVPFNTKSGKLEILWDYIEETKGLNKGEQVPISSMPTYGRYCHPVPSYIPPTRGFHDPLVAEYPLTMISSHSRYRNHSAFLSNPMLLNELYRHDCWISVADAKARGIKDGDCVSITNNYGTIVMVAYVTNRISPGVILVRLGGWFLPNASGIDRGGCPNAITGDIVSPVLPAKGTTIAQVEKF